MSAQFIGLNMLVTLRSPDGAQLRGRVSSVLAGQSLTLRDVYSPSNGTTITEITIRATNIRDLVESIDEKSKRPGEPQVQLPVQLSQRSPVEAPSTSTIPPFEDPAILRIGHPPISQNPTATRNPVTSWPRPTFVEQAAGTFTSPVAKLVEPLNELDLSTVRGQDIKVGLGEGSEGEPQIPAEKKRGKRRTRKGGKQNPGPAEGKDTLKDISSTTTNRGKGWRQTPILEPAPSFQPFSTLKNQSQRTRKGAYSNGWATEDATDVQDMGEFDFAANLSKFDKRAVFDGIRTDDMTADEDRLVGHNRLPKPGTAGGKNFHPTENVLDGLSEKPPWNSEAELSDAEADGVSHRDTGSGRTSRRAESRIRKSLSRKDTSVHSSQHTPAIPQTHSSPSSTFYLVPANRRCDVVSALQMLNLENIADSEFGLTEDMMTENAARGIAEVALSALNAGGRRLTQDNGNFTPYVIVYVGNNKSGLRAVAAGRHLRNHGVNIVVVVLGLEREPELLDGLRRQLKVFRNFGGKVFTKVELMEYTKSLDGPIDLIIDGLLGLTISFEELRTGDQATAYELIEWANRSKVNVLAVDIPTGIDPTSGKVSIIDGKPLYIHSKFVVAMGAPKKGLLQAMGQGDSSGESRAWQLFVADIGIANQAWRKSGTRMRRGAEFEGTWVLGMRFQRGTD